MKKEKGEDGERSDRELVLKITRGDQRAFEMLYDRYVMSVLGLAMKICGDRALAEDVAQETFLSVWRRPGSYSPDRGTFSAYLLGMVHHKAVDAIRHEESLRRRERLVSADGGESSSDEALVEEAWISLRRDRVRSAVKKLSDPQREALELAYFEGLTYSEVAEKLGIPLGTAKTRLRDGMIRLRDILADERGAG